MLKYLPIVIGVGESSTSAEIMDKINNVSLDSKFLKPLKVYPASWWIYLRIHLMNRSRKVRLHSSHKKNERKALKHSFKLEYWSSYFDFMDVYTWSSELIPTSVESRLEIIKKSVLWPFCISTWTQNRYRRQKFLPTKLFTSHQRIHFTGVGGDYKPPREKSWGHPPNFYGQIKIFLSRIIWKLIIISDVIPG